MKKRCEVCVWTGIVILREPVIDPLHHFLNKLQMKHIIWVSTVVNLQLITDSALPAFLL